MKILRLARIFIWLRIILGILVSLWSMFVIAIFLSRPLGLFLAKYEFPPKNCYTLFLLFYIFSFIDLPLGFFLFFSGLLALKSDSINKVISLLRKICSWFEIIFGAGLFFYALRIIFYSLFYTNSIMWDRFLDPQRAGFCGPAGLWLFFSGWLLLKSKLTGKIMSVISGLAFLIYFTLSQIT